MDDRDGPNPSPEEIRELLKLIPSKKPPAPRSSRLLQPILDVLGPKWVRDFLFTPSPIHIPHLLSPTLLYTALACYTASAGVERTTRPYRRESQHASYSNYGYTLFCPTMTANFTTCGVGVWHSKSKGIPLAKRPSGTVKLNMRFARDARTRTLLYVIHCAEDNMYHFSSIRIESSTRFRVFAGFFHESFQDIALGYERELQLQDILPKLLVAQGSSQLHACSVCSAPASAGCECAFPADAPSHPYDFRYFMRGMAHHTGTSRAMASRIMFADGKPCGYKVMGISQTLQGILDAEVVRSLSKWSITEHVKSIKEDPLQSLLLIDGHDGGNDTLRKERRETNGGGEGCARCDMGNNLSNNSQGCTNVNVEEHFGMLANERPLAGDNYLDRSTNRGTMELVQVSQTSLHNSDNTGEEEEQERESDLVEHFLSKQLEASRRQVETLQHKEMTLRKLNARLRKSLFHNQH